MSKSLKIITVTVLALLVFAAAFCAAFFVGSSFAFAAEDEYLYVRPALNGETAGISSVAVKDKSTGNVAFFLPESYYVKFVRSDMFGGKSFYYFDFNGCGADEKYVIFADDVSTVKSSFSAVNTTEKVNNPYPNVQLTPAADGVQYGDTAYAKAEWSFYFLGETSPNLNDADSTNDALTQVFVKAVRTASGNDEQFFAVDKTQFSEYVANSAYRIPAHAEVIALIKGSGSNGTSVAAPANTDNSPVLRIVLIVGIVVPALVLALMLFRPSKKEQYDKARLKNSGERVMYDRDRRIDDDYRPERDEYEQRERSRRSNERDGRGDSYYDAPRRYDNDYDAPRRHDNDYNPRDYDR